MKILLRTVLVAVVIGLLAYSAYRYYLPATIAESLKSDQYTSLIPEETRQRLEDFKSTVARDVGDLPLLMLEANLDYDDLQIMLERLDPANVSDALLEMSAVTVVSSDQAFDILAKHITIEGYELEQFRNMFVRSNDVDDIRKAMDTVRQYKYLIPLSMQVGKEFARDLLKSARAEIEARLDALGADN